MTHTEESDEEVIFIPLLPGKGRRRGMMLSTAMPGAILILSTLSHSAETVGGLLLKIFSIGSGLAVVILSVMEFRKPGSNRWMGVDMISVLTGFLIIAQGAAAYHPQKDFQPAHLLFLAGFFYIFKGYMFPEAKLKKGFTVNDNEIIFKRSFMSAEKKISRINFKGISMEGNDIIFQMNESENIRISLKGAANQQEIFERLSVALK